MSIFKPDKIKKMKKIGLTCGVLLCAVSIFCQDIGSSVVIGQSSMQIKQKAEEDKATEGTPYLNDVVFDAVIKGYDNPIKLKYNAYLDEMEFEIDGTRYHLKKEVYPEVQILNKKYVYTTYKDGKETVDGFLVVLREAENLSFYKKEKIILIPAKKATTSYDTSSPAKYKLQDPIYYIGLNGDIVELPKNEKKFAQLFRDNEKQVLGYIQSNKISLKTEQDLIKLFNYLSSL